MPTHNKTRIPLLVSIDVPPGVDEKLLKATVHKAVRDSARSFDVRAADIKVSAPVGWVATYGQMGLEVAFQTNARDQKRAEKRAEDDHVHDRIDSWTAGDLRL